MPNILTREQVVRLKDWEHVDSYGVAYGVRDLIATLEAAWEERDNFKALYDALVGIITSQEELDALRAKLRLAKEFPNPPTVYELQERFRDRA